LQSDATAIKGKPHSILQLQKISLSRPQRPVGGKESLSPSQWSRSTASDFQMQRRGTSCTRISILQVQDLAIDIQPAYSHLMEPHSSLKRQKTELVMARFLFPAAIAVGLAIQTISGPHYNAFSATLHTSLESPDSCAMRVTLDPPSFLFVGSEPLSCIGLALKEKQALEVEFSRIVKRIQASVRPPQPGFWVEIACGTTGGLCASQSLPSDRSKTASSGHRQSRLTALHTILDSLPVPFLEFC
jgi:hypothetical protein